MRHVPSIVPQIGSAVAKPSPLRNAILSERALKSTREDERVRATGLRTGVGTTVERPAQSKHQIPDRSVPQDKIRPFQPDRPAPPTMQPSHQGSSSERNVASTSSHRQFVIDAVAPPPLKVSDSDPDIYFNDEDNDILLAIDDSAMQGVESSVATLGDVKDRVFDASRGATRSESSRGAGGTRHQIVTASVKVIKPVHWPLD
jgi:hypothetical protein